MLRSLLDDPDHRLQFSGHETFPLRYGWLKKAYDAVQSANAQAVEARSIFSDESAIAEFGVGKNMVASIRHWALTCGVIAVTETGSRGGRMVKGEIGRALLEDDRDPYLERLGSIWLLHWQIASLPGRAAAWHWAFNEFNEPTFSRDSMTARLVRRCNELRAAGRLEQSRIKDATLRRDVECFIRTYVARGQGKDARDEAIECPLAELALVHALPVGDAFGFRRGPKPTLPDAVFLYALVEHWHRHRGRGSFSVEALTHEPGSPGRVFLLDEESVAERLARMADLTCGALRWDEASGLRQVLAQDVDALRREDLLDVIAPRSLRGAA